MQTTNRRKSKAVWITSSMVATLAAASFAGAVFARAQAGVSPAGVQTNAPTKIDGPKEITLPNGTKVRITPADAAGSTVVVTKESGEFVGTAGLNPLHIISLAPGRDSAAIMMETGQLFSLGAAQPAGANPPAAGSEAGDPNDPVASHDSGIYLYTKDREGKPEMIVLERASVQGTKSGNFFGSAMTYGIVKAKSRAQIAGAHASIRTSDPSPVFYFYFDDKQAGLGKTHFGMNSLSNPNQFVLLKLEVKKADRETVIGKYSAWGSSSGADSGTTVPFKSERIRSGLYKVTVDAIPQGEFCFFASSGGVTAAGPIAMTTTTGSDIFDFGVGLE